MRFLRHNLLLWATCLISTAFVACSLAAAPAASAQTDVFKNACSQSASASHSPLCTEKGGNNLSGPNGIILKVANIFAFAGGAAAVLVILIGGFMYITAGGDSGKANSGRAAVTYALVGLVVIVLGRAIIGFVISKF